MAILIDSDILIEFERGRINIDEKIAGRESDEFYISVITVSELLHGVWRAKSAGIRAKRHTFVNKLLDNIPILPIDLSVAKIHAHLWAGMVQQGTMIGLHDCWIAATCLANDLTLITANTKHFSKVDGLKMENWLENTG